MKMSTVKNSYRFGFQRCEIKQSVKNLLTKVSKKCDWRYFGDIAKKNPFAEAKGFFKLF